MDKLERNPKNLLIYESHSVDRFTAKFLISSGIIAEMKGEDFFDETDIMTDYFHCSHYLNIEVGHYTNEKPYIYNGELAKVA